VPPAAGEPPGPACWAFRWPAMNQGDRGLLGEHGIDVNLGSPGGPPSDLWRLPEADAKSLPLPGGGRDRYAAGWSGTSVPRCLRTVADRGSAQPAAFLRELSALLGLEPPIVSGSALPLPLVFRGSVDFHLPHGKRVLHLCRRHHAIAGAPGFAADELGFTVVGLWALTAVNWPARSVGPLPATWGLDSPDRPTDTGRWRKRVADAAPELVLAPQDGASQCQRRGSPAPCQFAAAMSRMCRPRYARPDGLEGGECWIFGFWVHR